MTLPIGEWLKRGYVPAYGRKLSAEELKETASLLMPEGTYGPAFLTPKNYFVIKDYNFSDLYVLFVGHLSDRIAGCAAVRDAVEQERAAQDRGGRGDAARAHRRAASTRTRSTARPAC